MPAKSKLLPFWFSGIRVYIAIGALMLTLATWWWTHTLYGGTQLEIIRTQEIYGWSSVLFLALAMFAGPLLKAAPHIPGKLLIRDSRRAFGLAAAWFAGLHATILYFKQFNGINPAQLPETYKLSMTLGLIALIILGAMAATSVNALMRSMGVWWFRLHRLVHLAVVLVLIHAFMTGVHALTTVALASLGGLALFWIILQLAALLRTDNLRTSQIVSIALSIIVLAGVMTYGVNQRFEADRAAAQRQGHGHQ